MLRAIKDFLFKSDKPIYISLVKGVWYLLLASVVGILLLFIVLSFSNLPSVEQLENPKSELASEVYSASGEVLGRFYTENRVPVNFNDLSPHLIDALIATEDERFMDHCGIDFTALGRVAVKTVLLQDKSSGGASTITQQLAKLLFTGQRSNSMFRVVVQKLKEWIIAVRLERKYTKEEIIAMYLNKFNFINGAYGIKAASEIYFGKSQKDLDLLESAMLIGMLQNPSLYNPLRRPEMVQHRRMVVLNQMVKNRLLSPQAYEKLKDNELGLNFQRQTHVDGPAPYFRMELAKEVKNLLERPENLKSDGTSYDIYRDGLKIYTTIDPIMQAYAEEVVLDRMPTVQQTLWRTWRSLDPWTYRSPYASTDVSVEIRKWELTKLIRSSDRYQDLRDKYLSSILEKLGQAYPDFTFNLDDREIDRMVQEDAQGGVIAQLVKDEMISSSLAAQYRKVLKSNYFPTLRTQWNKLQEAAEKAFKEKVEMTVFMYEKLIDKVDDPKNIKAGPVSMELIDYDKKNPLEAKVKMTPLDSVKYHRMFLQVGMLAVDPRTGYVKAWVGGINHKYFKFDHTGIDRQVGSTFKPFVYATAIAQQGFSPCFQVYDLPVTIPPGYGNFHLGEEWTPRNSDGKYTGQLLTLKEGLRQSKNTVSARLMKELGDAEPVRDLIHQMGIDKNARYPNGRYRVPFAPSICLGSTDLSVMEMTGAYTTFANNGTYIKPTYLLRIEDKNGREIYTSVIEERNALNPNANYVMVEMLKYAGTGLGEIKSEVGGKTGTTNDYVDGWFMGITPNLVVGTWVGGEDRWIRFLDLTYGQGAYMAKPLFKEFMKRVEADTTLGFDVKARFVRPQGDLGIEMNCDEYRNQDLDLENENFDEEFSEDLFGDEQPKDDGTEDDDSIE